LHQLLRRLSIKREREREGRRTQNSELYYTRIKILGSCLFWCTSRYSFSPFFFFFFLFALYTADCRRTDESCPVVKFADDTELVGKISNDEDAIYHKQTENFVNWCDKNYLYLGNVSKTKEMCIDFRKNQRCPKTVCIKGEAVERVLRCGF